MKQVLKLSGFFLLIGLGVFFSCQKELACYTCNNSPKANAGIDQKITLPKDSALLDGSASSDDGKIANWLWIKIAGPNSFTVVNTTATTTVVKNLVAGVYSFELKVTDDNGASSKDTVQVIVDNPGVNQPPLANAGPDQIVNLPKDSTTLDGSKTIDPDNNITVYSWTKISGPSASTIVSANGVQTRVRSLVQGVYEFELKVTDAVGLSARDTVRVAVSSSSGYPVADAGPDQAITLPASTAMLNGSKSTDPDNNITAYSWTNTSGPSTANIANANNVVTLVLGLGVGVYEFELKVTDASGLTARDTVKIAVSSATVALNCGESNRPVINAQLIPFAKLSEPCSGMAVAAAGNKIVFAGASLSGNPPNYGSSTVHIFDISTQVWSTAKLSAWRADVAAVAAGNKIFFAGGRLGNGGSYSYFATVDIYDVITEKWSVANLSQSRAYIAAATVGDKVFFAGGEQEWPRPVSDRIDIYDLSTNIWSTSTLSVQRNGLMAVTANNRIYFAGGTNQLGGVNNVSNVIDVYNNASNSWSTTTLSEPKAFFGGINVGNKIYWAGGYDGFGKPTCKVEIKDLGTQASSTASLFQPFSYVTQEGQNTLLKDNKIIWFATLDPMNGNSTDKFNIYDIINDKWSIGLLPVKINGASVISVNNTVYVAGGYVNGRMTDQVWKLEF